MARSSLLAAACLVTGALAGFGFAAWLIGKQMEDERFRDQQRRMAAWS